MGRACTDEEAGMSVASRGPHALRVRIFPPTKRAACTPAPPRPHCAGRRDAGGVRRAARTCVLYGVCAWLSRRCRCAVKIISKKVFKTAEDRRDMLAEVEMMRRLAGNTHVVNMFHSSEDKERFFIVLELATGGDVMGRIEKMLENHEHFSEKVASRYFQQMLLGVKHCHDNLIVHRYACRRAQCTRCTQAAYARMRTSARLPACLLLPRPVQ
ncbi:hypothetical protein EON67_05820 [archaeon]|nr:MAG: hypothetical protein EON67_05820 [archaeon]